MPTRRQVPVYNPAAAFATDVALATGIDPRVVYTWEQQEGAYALGGTGHFNFLNIRGRGHAGSSPGGFAWYSNLKEAETETIHLLKSSAYGTTIARAPSKTPRVEIEYIAASPWDAGHYGGSGGPRLVSAFSQRYGDGELDRTPIQLRVDEKGKVLYERLGSGSAADWTSGGTGPAYRYTAAGLLALLGAGGLVAAGGAGAAARGAARTARGAGRAASGLEGKTGIALGLAALALFFQDWAVRIIEVAAGSVLILLGLIVFGKAAAGSSTGAATRGAVGLVTP